MIHQEDTRSVKEALFPTFKKQINSNLVKQDESYRSTNPPQTRLNNVYLIDNLNLMVGKNKNMQNLLKSEEDKKDDSFIEMKNESKNNNENIIKINSNESKFNITTKLSKIINIDKIDLLNIRYKVSPIELFLGIEYDYSKNKQGNLQKTTHSSNFFITFVDYTNSIYKFFMLFNYLKKFDHGFRYFLCVRDTSVSSRGLSKFHIFVQYNSPVILFYSKLNTRDVDTIGLHDTKVVNIMKSYGVVLDEIGETKHENPLNIKYDDMINNPQIKELYMSKLNNEFDVVNFGKNCFDGFRDVYYFYGGDIDHFNDLLMNYLKLVKVKYDVIYYKEYFWEGFQNKKVEVGVYPCFSDEDLLLSDFVRLITYNRTKVEYTTKSGVFENNYKRIIFVSEKSPVDIYIKFRRPDWTCYFHVYKIANIKDEQNIHEILQFYF